MISVKMDLFDIEKLECCYPSHGKPVLYIEKLTIPKGRMTVILGRSGSGKSTLLEALGLMNNTIRAGVVSYFSPAGVEDLAQIWCNRKKIGAIRREYFSFIFQDDYLMPHYTCMENILVTGLIQGKYATATAGLKMATPLGFLNLSGNGLLKLLPGQLAGGQKQRLSFARAVIREFDVLFGDEPTGNLDYTNSVSLFDFIKLVILEKSATAIIVSHNVDLSVEKADRIIVLTPSVNREAAGFVLRPEHIFDRDDGSLWENFHDPQSLANYIKSIL
ncbi:MAG: ABC transporter ATP-binding protein [Bacteroidota bacterium]